MKHIFIFITSLICLAGCSPKQPSDDDSSEKQHRTAVTLTHGAYGHIDHSVTFQATTVYRNKSVATAPVSGFIKEQFVTVGSRVKAGQLLCVIESKEHHAIGDSGDGGLIPIKAMRNGIVLDVAKQTGDFVAEGTTLCVVAEMNSLVFEIRVPYEQREMAHSGGVCTLELPDGARLAATVQATLASMDAESQSELVTASANAPFLPEGLNVKAKFSCQVSTNNESIVLPESAVQSDETLTSHWVMKITKDSTTVKVPVRVVGRDSTMVEVTSDRLSPKDRIVLTGGYDLEQGAKVAITKKEAKL